MADMTDIEKATGESAPVAFFAPGKDPFLRTDPPVWSVTLWPNRSLSKQGFRWLLCFVAAGMALPVIALSWSPVALGLAPYAGLAFLAFWGFMKLNYRAGRLTEALRLWPDAIAVERREPWGRMRRWAANPYWVDIDLSDTRTVERYLTLRGAGRRIELGAFLTPEERETLANELKTRIAALNRAA